jgi:hypothetical protein
MAIEATVFDKMTDEERLDWCGYNKQETPQLYSTIEIQMLLHEQRKLCADNLKKQSPSGVIPQWMKNACLTAIEEK